MMRCALIAIVIFTTGVGARAQNVAVPVDIQLPLFMKILSFDRNLKTRVGGEIVIGVVFQKKFRTSLTTKEDVFLAAANGSPKSVEGIPVRYIPIEINDDSELKKIIKQDTIHCLYITPMRSVDIEAIGLFAGVHNMLTLTGVPEYVESGLSVGLDVKGEKPQIIINLQPAKAVGVDFNPQLLNLAKIIY